MADPCWLCRRPLGEAVEWHHPVPKSRGGRDKVGLHPICHRTLHRIFTKKDLARIGEDRAELLENANLQRFLAWVEGKHPDFYAPTY